jgi:hypothetical protein
MHPTPEHTALTLLFNTIVPLILAFATGFLLLALVR